ncbi:tRNA (adenosine(37)-N6)-threonylcarbamoyltransferase complex ATPase subunit type 1 TsaE [Klenkia sp. PcliD-1-E]|uniref:tRNA (adenosine(37)-N6)-threonylcarbamoyltransferase complex ATPase subunit type 1 TsaE n=1 Tax=Klenkia sp. PcliD-1-E TaxID=2954492 RepID=UPI002097BBA4|nr:tRNA (adenosine(37)-N6)-threonylcarbamoyltransferase complex ATPase subunit type 1 TsaE [Klenkia sp. PcliD-1-E]MCO7220445.1 tRNA (adenosine(37)-N6)-threonylcarbamoyltransferase complex ATPase subunit type 1 TsaE [Klenkia sp. PcliD-1-E]
MRRTLATVEDTRALGTELAGLLRAGDLVVLSGPLGAGKTALTQGIGAGLGVPGPVTSPTFVLARVHRGGRLPLVHVDAYRLGSLLDVDDLDLDATVEESVTVVEWGHGLVEQLADEHLVVEIERGADDDVRTATLVPHGPSWTARLRPTRQRATVRVLLVDDADRVLLFHDSDAGLDPVVTWWMTPGGGIDDGEDDVTAVVRELAEETGLDVDPAQVRGPVARRRVRHGFSDVVVDQRDTFYVVRVPAFEVSVLGHTEDEQRTILGHRWWTRAELAAAEDTVYPGDLVELLDLGDDPARWPVELPDVDESTLP